MKRIFNPTTFDFDEHQTETAEKSRKKLDKGLRRLAKKFKLNLTALENEDEAREFLFDGFAEYRRFKDVDVSVPIGEFIFDFEKIYVDLKCRDVLRPVLISVERMFLETFIALNYRHEDIRGCGTYGNFIVQQAKISYDFTLHFLLRKQMECSLDSEDIRLLGVVVSCLLFLITIE
jgi:hypothetical protein